MQKYVDFHTISGTNVRCPVVGLSLSKREDEVTLQDKFFAWVYGTSMGEINKSTYLYLCEYLLISE